MRLLVAISLWVTLVLSRVILFRTSDTLPSGNPFLASVDFLGSAFLSGVILFGIIFTIIREAERVWGLKWWYVFTLVLPFYNFYLIGRVFWLWAGRIVGAPQKQVSTA